MPSRDQFPERSAGAANNVLQVPSLQREALEVCAGVIAGPPPMVAEIPESETLITTRWPHPELHEAIPALPVHIVATYYGPPAPRVWRSGNMRLSGTGRPGGIGVVGWPLGHREGSVALLRLAERRPSAVVCRPGV